MVRCGTSTREGRLAVVMRVGPPLSPLMCGAVWRCDRSLWARATSLCLFTEREREREREYGQVVETAIIWCCALQCLFSSPHGDYVRCWSAFGYSFLALRNSYSSAIGAIAKMFSHSIQIVLKMRGCGAFSRIRKKLCNNLFIVKVWDILSIIWH